MNPVPIARELAEAGAAVLYSLPLMLLAALALFAVASSRKGGV